MRVITGKYFKESTERPVKLYLLKESAEAFEGIDLTKLSEADQIKLKEIADEYWNKLNPFFKIGYRKFFRANLVKEGEIDV